MNENGKEEIHKKSIKKKKIPGQSVLRYGSIVGAK
jgi:hypothetical protein